MILISIFTTSLQINHIRMSTYLLRKGFMIKKILINVNFYENKLSNLTFHERTSLSFQKKISMNEFRAHKITFTILIRNNLQLSINFLLGFASTN